MLSGAWRRWALVKKASKREDRRKGSKKKGKILGAESGLTSSIRYIDPFKARQTGN